MDQPNMGLNYDVPDEDDNNNDPKEDHTIEIEEIPHGRKLTPTGSAFRMSAERLSTLSKPELLDQISRYKAQVAEALTSLDVKRVHLALAQNELEHREAQDARKLRAQSKPFVSGTGTIKIPIPIDRKQRVSQDPRSALYGKYEEWMAQGLSPEEIGKKLAELLKG